MYYDDIKRNVPCSKTQSHYEIKIDFLQYKNLDILHFENEIQILIAITKITKTNEN